MDTYDVWVDFMTMDDDGTVVAHADDVRPGLRVNVGDVVGAGSEDSKTLKARVMRVDINGTVVLEVIDVARRFAARA